MSKTKYFENNYTIYISQTIIDEYNLKNDYIKFFGKLNKSNIKYSSIFYKFTEISQILYLKQFNIDFNNIKRLSLIKEEMFGKINNDGIKFFLKLYFHLKILKKT